MDIISRFKARKGLLLVGGAPVDKIVEAVGTPAYVYDAGVMRQQYAALKSSIPDGVQIYYSVKANPNRSVANVFRRAGSGAEVASAAELSMALEAGFAPSKIIFAGPGKGVDEIELAVKNSIGSINIESETELDRVINVSGLLSYRRKPQRIALRVNLDFGLQTGGEVMVGGSRKFGVDEKYVDCLFEKAMSDSRVELTGFHCFAGTQFIAAKALTSAYKAFARWAIGFSVKKGFNLKTLNFGGGLGIPYQEGEPELDLNRVGKTLEKIKAELEKINGQGKVKILMEPGRYLVGPSGVYLSEVTDLKTSGNTRYVITNGGIHHALIPIALNKNYPTAVVNKMTAVRKRKYIVAGPLCATPDQYSRKVLLAEPGIGDILGIFNSGAYGYTAGMIYFLSHTSPAEVLVDRGKVYLIREPRKPDSGINKELKI